MTTLITIKNFYASPNCDCPYRLKRLGKTVGQSIECVDTNVRPIASEYWENQTRYAYGQACVLPTRSLVKEGMYYYIR